MMLFWNLLQLSADKQKTVEQSGTNIYSTERNREKKQNCWTVSSTDCNGGKHPNPAMHQSAVFAELSTQSSVPVSEGAMESVTFFMFS
jgi:hypothetical protein